jgi:hypothetical protein
MQRAFVCVAAVCLLFARDASAQSSQLEACVNQSNGTVKIVAADERCGRRETRVVWNVAGPQGPEGARGPEGPQGPQGLPGADGGASLQVVDSSTPPIAVGHLVGLQQLVMTPADDSTTFFALSFNSAGFLQQKTLWGFILYQSPNCAGDAYVNTTSYGRPIIEAFVTDGYVYYADEPLNPALNTAVSYYNGNFCGMLSGPPMNSTGPLALLRKRPLTDFTVRPEGTVTPPFRLKGQ